LLGAHYDASPLADRDPTEANRALPAPGANDGASGVAVLLELARTLDQDRLPGQVTLAFFDAQYGSDGAPAAAGVQEFIRASQAAPGALPQTAVLVDLLGGVAQQFTIDAASDPALSQQVWRLADDLEFSGWFVPETQAGLELGQTALAGAGVPTAVIAAGADPAYRTLQDTPDRIDPQGLARVGQVLRAWLEMLRQTSA
jgi:putative aminopeptidase FrvX